MTTFGLIAVGVATAFVAASLMEPWARVLHGKLWHGPLWSVHRSHHTSRTGRFERNDILSATHAPVAAALIMIGCNLHGLAAASTIGFGAGMTAFGFAYIIVHDGLVHGRLPVRFLARYPWLRRIRDAHAVHHARGAEPYGLFLGPRELKQTSLVRDGFPSARRHEDLAPEALPGTRPGAASRSS